MLKSDARVRTPPFPLEPAPGGLWQFRRMDSKVGLEREDRMVRLYSNYSPTHAWLPRADWRSLKWNDSGTVPPAHKVKK